MKLTEKSLENALQNAKPGQLIHFDKVTVDEMDTALKSMFDHVESQSEGRSKPSLDLEWIPFPEPAPPFNIGDHVIVHREPYWIRIEMDHAAIEALLGSGAAAATLLTSLGVAAWIGMVLASILGVIAACDLAGGKKGVNFYITVLGVHWYLPR